MSHVKAGGVARNLTDSNPKYLGVKIGDGETAKAGNIIVRQRGTKITAGKNTDMGKDHTIFALKNGIVKFSSFRKRGYDGRVVSRKRVEVVA